MVKINKAGVVYLKSEGNYVHVCTTDAMYEVRGKLNEILDALESERIFRVHRRYAVNSEHVKAIDNHSIYTLTGEELPFSKSFQYDELISLLKQHES